MPDEVHSPLLSLIKEKSLIDDLQYEEVSAEFKRTGKPVMQILQDFGVMDLDTILQAVADHLGTKVVSFRESDLNQQVIQSIPANTARMYECLPLNLDNGTLQVALVDPLNPARVDELGFIVKKDLQLVIAKPQIRCAKGRLISESGMRLQPTVRYSVFEIPSNFGFRGSDLPL